MGPALHPPERPPHTHTPKPGFGGRGHDELECLGSSNYTAIIVAWVNSKMSGRNPPFVLLYTCMVNLQRRLGRLFHEYRDSKVCYYLYTQHPTSNIQHPTSNIHKQLSYEYFAITYSTYIISRALVAILYYTILYCSSISMRRRRRRRRRRGFHLSAQLLCCVLLSHIQVRTCLTVHFHRTEHVDVFPRIETGWKAATAIPAASAPSFPSVTSIIDESWNLTQNSSGCWRYSLCYESACDLVI